MTPSIEIYWTKCWEKFEPTDTGRRCTLATLISLNVFTSLQQSDGVAACSSLVPVAINLDQYRNIYTNTSSSRCTVALNPSVFVETAGGFQLQQTRLFTHSTTHIQRGVVPHKLGRLSPKLLLSLSLAACKRFFWLRFCRMWKTRSVGRCVCGLQTLEQGPFVD